MPLPERGVFVTNPNIETYKGPPVTCKNCGCKLKPIYQTEQEGIGESTGWRWRDIPEGCQEPPPNNPDAIIYDTWQFGGGTTPVRWDPTSRRWQRKTNAFRVKSRKFTGKFGVEGCSKFCSYRCGWLWACKRIKEAQ